MGYADEALSAVRRVLATQPKGHVPLEARFERADDSSTDAEIVLSSKVDGRRHVVHVQVGNGYVGVNTSFYESKPAGDFKVVSFSAMRQGAPHRKPSTNFEGELHRALDSAADTFEPLAGPGIGTHPHAGLIVEQSALAAAAYNADHSVDEHVRIALNATGTADGQDVVTFVREDGTSLPIEIRTMPGGCSVHNAQTGELLLERMAVDTPRDAKELPDWFGHCLADAESTPPAP